MEFVIAGTAAALAGFLTNPFEVLKTRLQLQGELLKRGQHAIHYKNVFHAAYVVAKHDGILALQKGLVPATWIQVIMNGGRFGTYQYFSSRGYDKDGSGNVIFIRRIFYSGIGGVFGHYLSSPFHLVKTHIMAEAAKSIAVGHQHHHKGSWAALKKIYLQEGIKGWFRGGVASIPRAFVASTSQLTSFYYVKEWLNNNAYIRERPLLKSFLASMVGGMAISVCVTPFDLVLTRLYNQGLNAQGLGILYSGYFDCIRKIYKTEGLPAFYKGVGPMYLRLGPHSVLCLMFWDKLKEIYGEYDDQVLK